MATPDPQKTPEEQLIGVVNTKYRTNLSVDQVVFGRVWDLNNLVPADLPTFDIEPGFNSAVDLRSADGQPYEFATSLHYNRLALGVLFSERDRTFVGEINHTHELVPLLRQRLGFQISTADIAGHEIEGPVGYPKTVLLNAAPNSLLLNGSVEITLAGP